MKTWLMTKKQIIRIGVAIAALIVLILIVKNGCSRAHPEKRPAVTDVKVAVIHPAEVNDYYETSGTIKAIIVSDVASRVMGTITAVSVREGDRVNQGQELLTIDNKELLERFRAAQAAAEEANKALNAANANKVLANTTYKRYRKLFEAKAVSGQEMDEVANQKQVATADYARAEAAAVRTRANLEEAKINAGYSKIVSPITGVVTKKKIDVGSMAVPGMSLMVVEDVSAFEIDAHVDERLADKISANENVNVWVGSIGARLKGNITQIVPAVDPMSRTYLIKINIPTEANTPKPLKTGLYARVLIPQGKRTALLIPANAVVEKGQLIGVYAVDTNNIVSYRLIRVGKRFDDGVEVLSGIEDGQRIIIGGVENAIDGGILEEKISNN
jgi:RND family efflux transporter MFP subunit